MRLVQLALIAVLPAATAQAQEIDPFWLEEKSPEALAELAELDREQCMTVTDDFEDVPSLPQWNPRFVRPQERFDMQDEFVRRGDRAIAVSLLKSDGLWSKNKHKHELRIANQLRCQFGREIWYSFSFRIEGDYPRYGSTRWVVGQWKEESQASPFLAQRFDNGVFHITVQNNGEREVIAAAPGDYNADYPFFTEAFRADLAERGTPRDASDFARRVAEYGLRVPEGAIDVPAYRMALEVQDLDRFPFIADRPDYRSSEAFRISSFGDKPVLPNPTEGWVDMRYHVKGGRDGTGFVEVWANDEFIVRVEGAIGSDVFDGDTQYFKIGHYRDVEENFDWATIYVDSFKRGTSRANVD